MIVLKRIMLAAPLLLLSIGAVAAGEVTAPSAKSVPTSVLVGTDMAELSSFHAVPVTPDLAGLFQTETGGAMQTLILERTGKQKWRVTRSIAEPGEPPFVREYDAVRQGSVLLDAANGMELRAVENGVMVLEQQDQDLVPSDVWTFYLSR